MNISPPAKPSSDTQVIVAALVQYNNPPPYFLNTYLIWPVNAFFNFCFHSRPLIITHKYVTFRYLCPILIPSLKLLIEP